MCQSKSKGRAHFSTSYYKIKMKNIKGPLSACHLNNNKCYCMLYEGYAVGNIICHCTMPRQSGPSPVELHCLSNDVRIRFYEISWLSQRCERLSGAWSVHIQVHPSRKGEAVLLLNKGLWSITPRFLEVVIGWRLVISLTLLPHVSWERSLVSIEQKDGRASRLAWTLWGKEKSLGTGGEGTPISRSCSKT